MTTGCGFFESEDAWKMSRAFLWDPLLAAENSDRNAGYRVTAQLDDTHRHFSKQHVPLHGHGRAQSWKEEPQDRPAQLVVCTTKKKLVE